MLFLDEYFWLLWFLFSLNISPIVCLVKMCQDPFVLVYPVVPHLGLCFIYLFIYLNRRMHFLLTAPKEHMYGIQYMICSFTHLYFRHVCTCRWDIEWCIKWCINMWKCPSPKFVEQFSIFAIYIFCSWLFAHNYVAINKLQVLSTCLHTAGYSFSYSEHKPCFREPLHEQFN